MARMSRLQLLAIDVGIDLCRVNAGMPEQVLQVR